MRAYILKGSEDSKEEYVRKFIETNKIPPYNIFRFSETLSISDVREIKKNISLSSTSGKNRIVIIESDPTIEAQNALLKTLEELDSETEFFFKNDHELLPTVVSRCTIIRMIEDGKRKTDSRGQETEDDPVLVRALIETQSVGEALKSIEAFLAQNHEEPFSRLIFCLRSILVDNISRGNYPGAAVSYRLMKALMGYSALVSSNNLNARITAERLVLTNLL